MNEQNQIRIEADVLVERHTRAMYVLARADAEPLRYSKEEQYDARQTWTLLTEIFPALKALSVFQNFKTKTWDVHYRDDGGQSFRTPAAAIAAATSIMRVLLKQNVSLLTE